MNGNFVYLILLMFFAGQVQAQQEVNNTSKGTLMIRAGTVFNAEDITRLQNEDIGPRVNADFLIPINKFVKIGPGIGYYYLSESSFLPVGVSIKSALIERKTRLDLLTSMGYGLADRPGENGFNWAGVYVNVGLVYGIPITGIDGALFTFGLDYSLQERKYKTSLFDLIDSEMMHLVSISLGLSFEL